MKTKTSESNVYWIDGTVQVIENEDGSWSATDNGEETSGLEYTDAMRLALEFVLTDEDVDAWHKGVMTEHLRKAWRSFPVQHTFQVWGSHDGSEPLSVIVEA